MGGGGRQSFSVAKNNLIDGAKERELSPAAAIDHNVGAPVNQ